MIQQKIIRFPQVKELVGLSRSTIFREEQRGQFPKRRRIGPHSVGWLLPEIEHWISTRTAVASQNICET